jgi:putative hemolysin
MRITRDVIGIAILMMCGIVFSATAQTAETNGDSPAMIKARAYCMSTGGNVQTRVPVYGTNGPIQSWLRLAGRERFCQYTSASDGSRIHVSLRTLVAKKPTLATLAYYAQTPWNGVGQGCPASFYCSQLGGSDLFGGVNAAGGGWVKFNTVDVTLDACVFPDNSTIDSWGLLYHSVGIIRGTDLSTVLKYSNPYTVKASDTR